MIDEILNEVFGFSGLRADQAPVVDSIRRGEDVYAIMTTGGGKSLCFQATAIERFKKGLGSTIVVSPLISLMQDQVSTLKSKGINAGNINSSIPASERYRSLAQLHQSKMPIIYMSPEMLGNEEVKECLKQSHLSAVVYDEAHTVSVWGANFRPSYTQVNTHIQEVESYQGKRLQRCAFTATSHKDVTQDVIGFLGMSSPTLIRGNPDRPNISMHVEKSSNKTQDCLNILSQDPEAVTIIYCTTVRNVKAFSQRLIEKGYPARPYYAGLDDQEKKKTLNDFINGDIKTIVATIAFGMGIDKNNVRRVIHMDMPASIENYYQEIGRAGRDGKPSDAHLLYSPNDRAIHNYFIYWQFPSKEIIDEVKQTSLSLVSSGPQSFSASIIAQACRSDIDPRHVASCLNILSEFGVLETNQEIGTDSFMIAEKNTDNEVDYDTLEKRKSAISNKLSTMKRYALTDNCKRKFLLDYLSHHGESDFCGSCGSCLEKMKGNQRASDGVDSKYRSAVFQAIKACNGKYETTIAILSGRTSPRIKRRGYDQTSVFGAFSHKSDDDIRATIKKLAENGVIDISNNQLLVKSSTEINAISPKVSDLRNKLSQQMQLPAFMVMSEAQAKELSKIGEISTEDLVKIGLPEKTIAKATKIIDDIYSKSSNTFSL